MTFLMSLSYKTAIIPAAIPAIPPIPTANDPAPPAAAELEVALLLDAEAALPVVLAGLLVVKGALVVLPVTVVVFAKVDAELDTDPVDAELEPVTELEPDAEVVVERTEPEVAVDETTVVVTGEERLAEYAEQRAKPTDAAIPMSAALQAVSRQGVIAVWMAA
jgi:hypothetical protein